MRMDLHNDSMSTSADPSFQADQAGLEQALSLLLGELGQPSHGSLDLPSGLPEEGLGDVPALERLAPAALGGARRLGSPGFLAHMDPPTPWVAWAAAQWAAAQPRSAAHRHRAGGAGARWIVVGWFAPYFGMDGGHLVPGSTLANLTALWAARELCGVGRVVASEAAHLSVRKAAAVLGLDFRAVPVDERQRLREPELGDLSQAALVLTAGTTVTGAVDPLAAGLGDAAWRHVDAAWAGPLRLAGVTPGCSTGSTPRIPLRSRPTSGCFNPRSPRSSCSQTPESAPIRRSPSVATTWRMQRVGLLGSHGAAALPLAATLLAWGRVGMTARIDLCMVIMREPRSPMPLPVTGGSVMLGPETGVVVWRPAGGTDLPALRERLRDAFVLSDHRGGRAVAALGGDPIAGPGLVGVTVLRYAAGTDSIAVMRLKAS